MLDGNPYARMMSVIRDGAGEPGTTGPVKMRLGTVAQREPLEVTVGGARQPAGALKINERLTRGASWKSQINSRSGRFGTLSSQSGKFDLLPSAVTGSVTCAGKGCEPEMTSINGGTLNSSDVLIDQAKLEKLELDQAEHRQLELDLEMGDTVLLLTEDDQIFYILMKVVDAV